MYKSYMRHVLENAAFDINQGCASAGSVIVAHRVLVPILRALNPDDNAVLRSDWILSDIDFDKKGAVDWIFIRASTKSENSEFRTVRYYAVPNCIVDAEDSMVACDEYTQVKSAGYRHELYSK